MYRAGPNAVVEGRRDGELRLWGPDGTVSRLATPAPDGASFLGAAGPLWVVDREIPAPAKPFPVDASLVERAGFRMREVLGTASTGAVDPAKAGGVYVRSVVKVRRDHAPPVHVVTATGDDVGAGRFDGPADVRAGSNCRGALGLLDARGETLLASASLDDATRTCSVPVIAPPVDRDGDGRIEVLVHGQNGHAGFRAWFTVTDAGLEAGPGESWEAIP